VTDNIYRQLAWALVRVSANVDAKAWRETVRAAAHLEFVHRSLGQKFRWVRPRPLTQRRLLRYPYD